MILNFLSELKAADDISSGCSEPIDLQLKLFMFEQCLSNGLDWYSNLKEYWLF